MKLIQILALATAMATMATAQNGQNSAAKPSPSGTPVPAAKSGSTSPTAKKDAGTATKGAAGSSKPAATSAVKPTVTVKSGPTKVNSTNAATAKTTSSTPSKPQSSSAAAKTATPAPATKGTTAAKTSTAAKPAAKAPAVIAVKPVQTAPATKTAKTTASAKTQAKPPAKAPAPATKTVQASSATVKTEEKPKPVTRAWGAHGRRDPFVSPIRERSVNGPLPNCTSGKRCLAIPELVLQGTVKDTTGKMMAVVANSAKKTYFLRENDQVFNGSVEKITSDSIIFREYVKDPLGRETAREVVKKLVPAS